MLSDFTKFQSKLNGQDLELGLENAGSEEGVSLTKLTLVSRAPVAPEKISLSFKIDKCDCYTLFRPNAPAVETVHPDWSPVRNYARSASGVPVIAVIGKSDENRCTVALSDCKNPTCICAGFCEEDGCIEFVIEFFVEKVAPLTEYECVIRVDTRPVPACQSLRAVRSWWTQCGYLPAYTPADAALPVFSTWYVFHQEITSEKIFEQCRLAKPLGMDTVIIDDGWQTDDVSRGYAYCGDWQVCEKKLDLKKLVDELHAIDVKAMLWFSVPYVGIASAAAKRFRGKTLYYDEKVKAYALDPRFGEVRKYLVDTYVDFLRRYDLDGFKIDFIDVFMLTDQSSADYDAMDFVSLEDGVVALMHEISARLKSLKPDILLEFRESYVGPAMQQYGNMFRVGDCPGNAIRNKNVSVGLRLFADGAAVHSDPIMWNRSESVEDAAMQLNHSLFCVPQISVDLTRLPIDHRNMLAYYLRYQRDNRQTLLFSPLDVKGFAQNFVSVTACDDRKQITAIFLETTTELQPGRDIDLVNASPTGVILVRATEQMSAILTVCDCMGETVYETEFAIDGGVREIAVPVSGFAFFRGIKTYENRV